MNEMDKIMRSKLFAHKSELPSDLWGKIELEIKNEPQRRKFAWLWFASVGFTLVLAAAYGLNQYMNPQSESVFSQNNPENAFMVVEDKEDEELRVSHEIKNKQPSTQELEEFSKDKKLEPKNSSLLPLSKFVSPQSSSSKVASNLPSNTNTAEFTSVKEEFKRNESSEEIMALPDLGINSSGHLEGKKGQNSRTLLDAPVFIENDITFLILEKKVFPDPLGCPTFSRRFTPNIFVEAYYQPMLAMKQISPNSPEIGQNYIDLRRNTESQLYSWAAGVNVGWISDYDVGIKIGLNFEEINERFMYSDTNAIGNQTIITIDTMFNSDGTFSVTSDTLVQQVTGTEVQNIYNYHRTINLPIHALYQINFENLALEISGGPEFNISYSNRGKIVNPSNEDQWFTKGRSGAYDVFKTRLDVSFSLSIGLMYSINEKIQFYARPQFRYHPSSISRSTSPFSQRYLNSGLALGARYYFSGNPNY